MSTEKKDVEVMYNAAGSRVCGSRDTASGEPCMRLPDRGLTYCYRHSGERQASGAKPNRGRTFLDERTGIDTSYVATLRLGFDPQAADMQFEIELTNRHISALTKEYEVALRDVKAGRAGPNPRAIRAELTALFQTKTRLVKAQTQRITLAKDYVTRDQAVLLTHLLTYLAARHIKKDQLKAFFAEARACVEAPWKVSELPVAKGADAREAHKQAKQLFDELWTEQRPLPNAGDDTEDSEDDEPGEHEHPYDGEESTP